MNKRILFAAILFTVICLAGCQLAKEEAAPQQDDRLIGAFITDEYLDLFDLKGYISDNAASLSNGENVISAEDSAKYSETLWAEEKAVTLMGDNPADDAEYLEYCFPGVEGIRCFAATRVDPETGDEYVGIDADDGISDIDAHMIDTDAEVAIELSGTVYVAPAVRGGSIFFINPVYQTPDGRVYVVSGSGISSDAGSEGGAFSQTIEEKNDVTENGKSRQRRTKIAITIQYMQAPESIVIIEMDGEDHVLARNEFSGADSFGTGAEYLIVETTAADGSVSRELFDRNDDWIYAFSCREDGVCIKKATEIIWRE